MSNLLCALVYYVGARIGLALAFTHASASPVWPPTGIALAAVYLAGARIWPGIFLGALAANLVVFVDVLHMAPTAALAAATTIACGNTGEALVGVALWRRLFGERDPFTRAVDLLKMLAVIPIACLVSATVGAGAVLLVGTPASLLPYVWTTWWLGDVTGGIVLAPSLLLFRRDRTRRLRLSLAAWGALTCTLALTFVLFSRSAVDAPFESLSFLLLLPLLWIAFRHGLRETAAAVLLVCAVAVWGTVGGTGPFVLSTMNASLLVVQTFVAVVTVTMLSLAAALAERRESEKHLQELADNLERRVSERTRELSEVNLQLQQAQKMEAIGTLAGGIAHDFNNLLTAILMGTRTGREAVPPNSVAHESLAIAEHAAEQAADLVAQLLTLGRKRAPRTQRLDLRAVVSSTAKLLQRSLPKSIEIVETLPADPLPIDGDDAQLGQALLNLGINARDAMPEGGRLTLSASVETLTETAVASFPNARAGKFVVVHVQDTGHGMDAKTLEHIFEPFFTTKDPGRGTGLGLAMVYACIRDHGGFIRTQSRRGEGTHFELCIPLAQGLAEPARPPVTKPAAELPGRIGRVMVVDDDPAVMRANALMLRRDGHHVKTASNGSAALEMLRENPEEIELIVTDMIMPGLGGRGLLKAARAEGHRMPVVLTTGRGVEEDAETIRREGFAAFLPKPFPPSELCKVVRDALAQTDETPEHTA